MDDEEYARELFAILTAPAVDPVDEYGTGADRIDRYDGFGTEVRVTSLDVVPGKYGDQVAVGFVLEVPPGIDVPPAGTVQLPFAAEWRAAQGHLSPALHAPSVASNVMRGVRRHVSRHRDEPVRAPALPDRAEQRALLLDVLGRQGEVEEVAAGRFDVRRPPGRRELTVIVTAEEWEQVVRRHGTRRAWLFEHFDEFFGSKHSDDVFIVFWEGDLVGSVRDALPPVSASLRELLALYAARDRGEDPYAGGAWFAYTPLKDH